MSNTTTNSVPTPHAAPTCDPLTGLTGAPAAIYTQLTGLTDPDGVTAVELALAAGVGRSTAGKALTTLEQRDLAVRTPGSQDGPRRTPDLWRPAPHGNSQNEQQPNDRPEPSTDSAWEPVASNADSDDASTRENAPHAPVAPDDSNETPILCPSTDEPSQDTEHGEGDSSAEDSTYNDDDNHIPETEDTGAPQAAATQQPTRPQTITSASGKKRLAPGALRQMVIDHLQANPSEAFTATKISRVIEKSSGAIANALITLTRQGITEQVSDKPLTYRFASTGPQSE